jgi:hypothetical protein
MLITAEIFEKETEIVIHDFEAGNGNGLGLKIVEKAVAHCIWRALREGERNGIQGEFCFGK